MNPSSLQGHWKGEFTYGASYGEKLQGIKEQFSLFIEEINDGSFSGRCVDLEARNGEFIQTRVQGFIDKDFISFKKEYSFQYVNDENGNFFVNKDKKGHAVNYEGQFNTSAKSFSGIWEINTFYQLLWFKWFAHTFEGTWAMYKEV